AGTVNTPVVVQNATSLALGPTPNPAQLAATAAAQAQSVAGGKPQTAAPAPAGTPAPAGQAASTAPPAGAKVEAPKPGTRVGIVQPAWETLRLREQDLSAQVRLVNTADMDDYQRNIDQLIRSGSNVII